MKTYVLDILLFEIVHDAIRSQNPLISRGKITVLVIPESKDLYGHSGSVSV